MLWYLITLVYSLVFCMCDGGVVWCYLGLGLVFFFKQKTAYEMRISDWSSDVCSSDLRSRATAACEMVWRKARADSDFKAFAKAFRPVLDLTREEIGRASCRERVCQYV